MAAYGVSYPTCSQRTKLPRTDFPKVLLLPPSHLLVGAAGRARALGVGAAGVAINIY